MLQAVVLSHAAFARSATAFATELAGAFGCARVTLGCVRRGNIELVAVSHGSGDALVGTDFDAIAAAMDEAVQQTASICLPARAQLALVDADIARSALVAPFDGIVIQGDLAQSIGSPVERGKPLPLVAPGEAFRVVVQVDERDVAELRAGQTGSLSLAALPWDALPITVSRITPIARAVDASRPSARRSCRPCRHRRR